MALFNWNAGYETGIETIDTQHKKLVDYINRLNEGIEEGKAAMALKVILDGLVSYTEVHFKYEENLFNKHGYENQEEHVAHHKKLVSQVVEFRDKFTNGEAEISNDLMDFLKKWLMDHILKEDMKYVQLFKENKVP